jgi:hypothetical protein
MHQTDTPRRQRRMIRRGPRGWVRRCRPSPRISVPCAPREGDQRGRVSLATACTYRTFRGTGTAETAPRESQASGSGASGDRGDDLHLTPGRAAGPVWHKERPAGRGLAEGPFPPGARPAVTADVGSPAAGGPAGAGVSGFLPYVGPSGLNCLSNTVSRGRHNSSPRAQEWRCRCPMQKRAPGARGRPLPHLGPPASQRVAGAP